MHAGATVSKALRLTCYLLVIVPATASSWNQATHAYIADRVGARAGHDDLNEMWGSVAPDFFNFIFDPALCPGWISDETHGTYSETFLKVWNAATGGSEAALAYGFVTHNQRWGADFTAHVSGRTFGQSGGYVITKAAVLLDAPFDQTETFDDALATLGMSPHQRALVAHVMIESAVDVLLRNEVDPLLGRKLARAARGETKGFPDLLAKALKTDYAAACAGLGGSASTAARVLTGAEEEHRSDMIFLGEALSRPEPVAVRLLAEQLAGLFPDFLGGPLPVPETKAIEIVEAGIFTAMSICGDYRPEIDATVDFVDRNLEDHGIKYSSHGTRG